MNTVAIEIDGARHDFNTPETWDECSNRQLYRIWDVFNQPDGEVALFQQIHLIYFLMATPCAAEPKLSERKIRKRLELILEAFDGMINPEDEPNERAYQEAVRGTVIAELMESMAFMKEPLLITSSRGSWLLGWRGFNTQIQGMSFEQFALANVKLREFLEQQSDKALNELIAVLYRPFFMPWMNRFKIIECYAWMAALLLPKRIKLRIQMLWKGHLDWLMTNFPNLTREREDDPDPYGFESTYVGLAGDKFGTYAQVKRADALPVLINLELHAKRQFELEEQLEKKKE